MSDADNIITVNIMGRDYKVKCPSEQIHELQKSAQHVNEQMRKVQQQGHNVPTERVAVVAALNICNELILLQKEKNCYIDKMNQRIKDLQNRIENVLATNEEVTV